MVPCRLPGRACWVSSDTTWNTLADGVTTLSGLVDSTGVATTVGVTCTSPGSWNDPTGNMPSSYNLLSDYRFTGGGVIAVTVTGLDPTQTYDLVAYGTGNDSGQGGNFYGAVSGVTTPTTRASFVLNNNYVQNPVVAPDSTGTVSFYLSNSVIQCFNGLQIQLIPPAIHAPIINTNPASQVIRQGATANLTVSVDSGSLLPAYQWYFGSSRITGATNFTYTIANVQSANAGSYTVIVTNQSGSATSSPPAILTVDTTTTTTLFIGGDQGQGLDLKGGNFEVAEYYSGTDFGALAIQGASFTNNPNRIPTAIYSGGAAAPNFGSSQNNQNLSEIANNLALNSGLISFTVPTVNGESYKLQLLFHDPVVTGPGARVLQITVGSEVLEPALDIGATTAIGSNPLGVVLTYYFTGDGNPLPVTINNSVNGVPGINALTLQHLPGTPQVPYLSLAPQNQQGQQGGNASFNALAGGSIPPFTYQWYFIGTNLTVVTTNLINGATNPILNVLNAQPTAGGQYAVVASTSAGSVTNSATLNVNSSIQIVTSTGPAPGQGMNLLGNFALAEHYGASSPDLPMVGVDFVYSTRTAVNAGTERPPISAPLLTIRTWLPWRGTMPGVTWILPSQQLRALITGCN